MRSRGFKPRGHARAPADPDRVRPTPTPVPGAFRAPATVSGQVNAAPKDEKLRNESLLKLARGEPCMLMIPGVCSLDSSTSVQCHSNLGVHGKGGGTKAHDCCSFSGCSACHFWLDQDKKPSYEEKHAATMAALSRQIQRWTAWLDVSQQYSSRHRNAASWALSGLHSIAKASKHAFNDGVHGSLNASRRYCINALMQQLSQ